MYVYNENKQWISPVCALKILHCPFPHKEDMIHTAQTPVFLLLIVSETGYVHVAIKPTEPHPNRPNVWVKIPEAWYRDCIRFIYYNELNDTARTHQQMNVDTIHVVPQVQLYETNSLRNVLTSPLVLGFISETKDKFRVKLHHSQMLNYYREWIAIPTYQMKDGRYFTPFYQNRWGVYVGYMFLDTFVISSGNTKNILCANCDMAADHSMLNTENNALDRLEIDTHRLDIGYELDRMYAKERWNKMHHAIFKELMEACWHPRRIAKMMFDDINAMDSM